MALTYGRPRADRVEPRDERERPALQVVEAAGAHEPDLVLREARLRDHLPQDRDDHLGLVVHRITRNRAARERNDCNIYHQR